MTNYLVSDLDHTLLNERGALSPVTQAVVELVAERFGEVNFTWMDAAAWHVSFVDAAVEFDQRLVPVPLAMDGLKPAGALMLLMIVSDPGMFQTLGQLLKSAFPKLTISPAGDG